MFIKNPLFFFILIFVYFVLNGFTLKLSEYSVLDKVVTLDITSGSAEKLLGQIEKKADVIFSYSSKVCMVKKIVFENNTATIKQFLDQIFATCFVEYSVIGKKIVILPIPWRAMKFKVRGFVTDSVTGEVLISANIFDLNGSQGAVSNDYGYYNVTISGGEMVLGCSYIGYVSKRVVANITRDTLINFQLSPMPDLEEIPVVGQVINSGIRSTQTSAIDIPVSQLQNVPSFFGEVDLVKTIQLFPGVQSGNEGLSGMYVRGGGQDQNLILLDEIPIYNIEHLLGFFSVFNPDAINKVKLIKGGFPAQYGGRLSSVLDIKMKEGNIEKMNRLVSVGLLSSKFAIDGPLRGKNTTYTVSYRRTYYDLVAAPFQSSQPENSDYYFFDFNGKINHQFSNKSRVFVSSYWGRDKLNSKYDFKEITKSIVEENQEQDYRLNNSINTGWGNFIGSLRWNYIFNDHIFSNFTLSYSQYNFYTLQDQNFYENESWNNYRNKYKSGIRDLMAKADFDYFPKNGQHIKFGINYSYHRFYPGIEVLKTSQAATDRQDTIIGGTSINGSEMHAYIQDDVSLNSFFKLNAGIHFSVYTTAENTYYSLEPRLATRFLITSRFSLKAAYSLMSQYVHLLNTANVSLPTDMWLPVTESIKPQKAWQIALGGEYEVMDGFTVSTEVYYKANKNLLDYKESQSFFDVGTAWSDKLTSGSSNSYGIEFLTQRQIGDWVGWFGYAYSENKSLFPELNNGKPFWSNNDRRHDLSLFLSYSFNSKVNANLTWMYASGKPVTLPSQKYYAPDLPTLSEVNKTYSESYTEKNGYNMPDFHRLDLGVNFIKQKSWGKRTWSIGVMNAYGHQNPFFLYYSDNQNPETGEVSRSLKQFSLFAFPFPFIRYTVNF